MAISKRVRFDVFKRDLFTCQYCGKRPPDVVLEVDHIHPKSRGGSDEPDNLTTSCLECNRGKGALGLGEVAPALSEFERLAAIQEMSERALLLRRQADSARQIEAATAEAVAQVREHWGFAMAGLQGYQEESVRLFLRRGLEVGEIIDAIESTATKRNVKFMSPDVAWRYFCGACWGKIREREGGE